MTSHWMVVHRLSTRALKTLFFPLLVNTRFASSAAFVPQTSRRSHNIAMSPTIGSVRNFASTTIGQDELSSPSMTDLKELDNLTVRVIVDNESDAMSTGLEGVDGFEYIAEKHGAGYVADDKGLCLASHGFSLLLTGELKGKKHTLLLDAGPNADVWKNNAAKLGVDLTTIEAVVLSHYHWDHSAGLIGAIPAMQGPVLADLHSSQITLRGRPQKGGGVSLHKPNGPSPDVLASLGARVHLSDQEHTLCDDFFCVSGYIPRKTHFEQGIPNHMTNLNGKWIHDEEIPDERYVACHVRGRGIVLFSSCSHAGIVNVCHDARQKSGKRIFGIVGGFHLGGKQVESRIDQTLEGLEEVDPKVILAGHCTGWRAKAKFATELADRYQPLAVGGTYMFYS